MTSSVDIMNKQRGGFVLGLIIGLLVGLALALGVALYVTKVPIPFVNKVPQRTAEQDAAETEKNKNWDPNSPLSGKTPMKPGLVPPTPPFMASAPMPGTVTGMPAGAMSPTPVMPPPAASTPAARAGSPRDPSTAASANAATAPPIAAKPGIDPFTYFVQAGAYARQDEAEQQRARLAMMGLEARITEREQGGRTVYRVRVGPFDNKDDAEVTKERIDTAGIETALVRIQK